MNLTQSPLASVSPRLIEKGILSALDVRFGLLILRLSGSDDFDIFIAAALTSRAVAMGHVCMDLKEIGSQCLLEAENGMPELVCPAAEPWLKGLKQNRMVGKGDTFTPLVLDTEARLYLYRFWQDETSLAKKILSRIQMPFPEVSRNRLKAALARLFPRDASASDYLQGAAAYITATRRLCVISGGPGTGKTFTAAKILAMVSELEEPRNLRIHLAAPTGKAAARLKESIRLAKGFLPVSDTVKAMIPEEAATLHRLLGSIPGRTDFRFCEKNPLPADLVIIDEASMIDLPLMARLFRALPESSRIVLMGDSDQLASVEAGYVLKDICGDALPSGYVKETVEELEAALGLPEGTIGLRKGQERGLSDCIVSLQKNYRFSETSGIGRLSRSVIQGDADGVMDVLCSEKYDDIQWVSGKKADEYQEILSAAVLRGFKPCLKAKGPQEALNAMERFRILCAVNKGPFGVETINAFAEKLFQGQGLIPAGMLRYGLGYRGMPVLITRNHYETQLFNGDTGLIWSDPEKGRYAVFSGTEGKLRVVPISRLPEYETAFAMTVHKSQGSEFDEVFLILSDADLPLLTRELLYTGITRARHRVVLWGSEEVIRRTVSRRIQRRSGLKDALWGSEAP